MMQSNEQAAWMERIASALRAARAQEEDWRRAELRRNDERISKAASIAP
jgi:hypothetical protein